MSFWRLLAANVFRKTDLGSIFIVPELNPNSWEPWEPGALGISLAPWQEDVKKETGPKLWFTSVKLVSGFEMRLCTHFPLPTSCGTHLCSHCAIFLRLAKGITWIK